MTAGAPHITGEHGYRARRQAFVAYLYRLHDGLTTQNAWWAAESRQALAKLRRSFAGPRQQAEAYDVVLPHNPPECEEEVWVLLAGLFALHPQPRRRGAGPRSLGSAMQLLEARRGAPANRRFVQLLSVGREALPHYLRQVVRLLHAEEIPLDYEQLLEDLVDLLDTYPLKDSVQHEDAAHRVRLRWARDFHRQERAARPDTSLPTT